METKDPQSLAWWQRGVVYQIYPRSFKDTTGNGVGDLQGVIDRLEYLNGSESSLGIDAIWLSPFYPSPMADFGYDVADYCDVDPLFGDLATFDRLLREAHRRGIKVIIDYVPNHTSDQHPWFLESRLCRNNPKRDWYIWKDPQRDGSPPNNWGSVFGGGAWEWDETTGQFYFHHFLKEQPDLNWRNPEVREAMMEVLRFWLERGVDGFRMDVVGMIFKDEQLRDNPMDPNAPEDLPPENIFARQLNIYNQDLEEVQPVLAGFRQLLESYGERAAIGEVWSPLPRWVRYYGEQGDCLHLPFNFRLINLPWTASSIRRSVDEMEAALPFFAWPNYVLGNHDVPRLASRLGQAQARLAAMLLLALRGTPTLYYGDELGLENGFIPEDKLQDPQGLRLGPARTRDVSRTPMQWNASPNAGFTSPEVEPWLPVSEDIQVRNVDAQLKDEASVLNLYRKLLAYRRGSPALLAGSYRAVDVDDRDCYVFIREHASSVTLAALNFTSQPKELDLLRSISGRVAISTYLDRSEAISGNRLHLRPDEGVIIELEG